MANTHYAVPGSTRQALPGAIALGPASPHQPIEVTIKLRRKKALPDLHDRPAQPMPIAQIGATYGATRDDVAHVVKTFARYGLAVIHTDTATRTVHLSGDVAQMEKAFAVRLFNYAHESGNYRGRVGPLHVPTALKDIVTGVFGLDNRRVARRHSHSRDLRLSAMSLPSTGSVSGVFAKHYNFPQGDGAGQTVGVLEFGGGYFPSDLEAYCQAAGIKPPTVVAVSTDGISTSKKDGTEGEVMLDIEVIAGVCPKAKIVSYFAHFTERGWITILDAAMHDTKNKPTVLSASWGYVEDMYVWTQSAMNEVNETLKEAAYAGITVCVCSGDDGSSAAQTDGIAHVWFPATSPYALAVGGTTITSSGADICWKEGSGLRADNDGSTGGGVSVQFARPSWQSKIAIKSVNPGNPLVGRCMPDVAANADWTASPYLLYVDGGRQPNGGTSAATPLWAALIALINAGRSKPVGYITPLLYGSGGKQIGSQGCKDVTKGDNITAHAGGYAAGRGYDAATGWGVPNGIKLKALL